MGRITGDLKERTLCFGTQALAGVAELPNEARGWIIAKQLGKAATSIGANVWEADAALTDADFAHKISIARKEASETQYWLELARRSELLSMETYSALATEVTELTRILGTIVRKTQEHIHGSKTK
jgi:four helix bundle protein